MHTVPKHIIVYNTRAPFDDLNLEVAVLHAMQYNTGGPGADILSVVSGWNLRREPQGQTFNYTGTQQAGWCTLISLASLPSANLPASN